MQVSLTVCNVCQDTQRPTQKYEVRSGGRKATPDLCEEHAAPLEALMPAASAPRKATPPRRRQRVVSMEEIEASKKGS